MTLYAVTLLVFVGAGVAQTAKPDAGQSVQTKIVILGVAHSAQLVSEGYQPAMFRALFDRIKPDAICVERSPQEFARSDFYEFTYEAQSIVVPYGRAHHIEICPIDYLPSPEDSLLAWGVPDIESPPFLRNPSGFQGFVQFDDPGDLKLQLFDAEGETERAPVREWADTPPKDASVDFSRRLYLYRTYMQAMRIRRFAQKSGAKTIVVVIGSMHKDNIERILTGYPEFAIVQPSAFGAPDQQTFAREIELPDLFAIACFNLLGTQAKTGNVDWDWMTRILNRLEKEQPSPETALLKTRLGVLTRKLSAEEAIPAFEKIQAIPVVDRFTFNGVKDAHRLDSYFDPFGSLNVQQRASLELAREEAKLNRPGDTNRWKEQLLNDAALSELQRAQLRAYWDTYVVHTF